MGMQNGVISFSSAREAMASPLAKRIFGIDGVTGVFFGADFITVTKKVWAAERTGLSVLLDVPCHNSGGKKPCTCNL
jgi:hypothetical protein